MQFAQSLSPNSHHQLHWSSLFYFSHNNHHNMQNPYSTHKHIFKLVFNGYYMILSSLSFFRLVYEIQFVLIMHKHKKDLLLMKKIVYFTNCPRKSGKYMKIRQATFSY